MKKLFKKRWDKHYKQENKNGYWHLTIDTILVIIVIGLVVANIYISNRSGFVLGIQYETIINEIENNDDSSDTGENDISTSTEDKITKPEKELPEEEKPEIVKPKTTNIELKSFARYYTTEGEQLGIGPIPPKVGVSTSYWIFISISNFNNDLENVEFSATMPTNVSSTGNSSITWGNNIEVEGNEISWKLDSLKKNNKELIAAAFEIKITPTNDQVGLVANLLENISVSATDLVTGKNIDKTNPVITTNIKNLDGRVIGQ